MKATTKLLGEHRGRAAIALFLRNFAAAGLQAKSQSCSWPGRRGA
jgi:hypothetical protein